MTFEPAPPVLPDHADLSHWLALGIAVAWFVHVIPSGNVAVIWELRTVATKLVPFHDNEYQEAALGIAVGWLTQVMPSTEVAVAWEVLATAQNTVPFHAILLQV